MLTIDEFEACLEEIAEDLPQAFFEGLNGGIIIAPETKLHPQSRDDDLFILGEYCFDPLMGRYIVMYYGSFAAFYNHHTPERWRQEMRTVLVHEFRHHLEGRAGVADLIDWDDEQIAAYHKSKDTLQK